MKKWEKVEVWKGAEESEVAEEGVVSYGASLYSLSKEYKTRKADFFKPGRVFATAWAETTGQISGNRKKCGSRQIWRELLHPHPANGIYQ